MKGARAFLRQWDLQLMVVPAILFVFVFSYIPMYGVLMGFQDYDIFKGFFQSSWVGFKHFEAFFNAPEFWRIMRNTICISLLKLFIGFPAPIVLALMLNEVGNRLFKRVIQTVTYLPHFLSWVIVGGFVMSMLATDNGSLNILLMKLDLIDEPINFLSIPEYSGDPGAQAYGRKSDSPRSSTWPPLPVSIRTNTKRRRSTARVAIA